MTELERAARDVVIANRILANEGVVEIVYGRTASAWAWTTAWTSGLAS